jgi:hypothetical protein
MIIRATRDGFEAEGAPGSTVAAVAAQLIAAGLPPDTLVELHGKGARHPTYKLAVLAEPHRYEGTP